jgi:6-phosphogluconolactonase
MAANGSSRNLTVFQVNQSTGALTAAVVQPPNTLGASGIVNGLAFVSGDAGFLYALQDVDGGSNQIHGFRINPATGALTPVPGLPITSGGTGSETTNAELIAYRNGRVYAVNDGGDTLSAFTVNRTTGALTALPFSPITLGSGIWRCVAVHPSGSPVVVGRTDGALASFDVGATTAVAAAGSPFDTGGAGPTSCAFSRDGSYVYTGGNGVATIAGFSVNAGTGVLTPLAGSPFNSGATFPAGYATDADGRLFIADANAQQVRAFTTSAGVPAGVSGNPFASGLFSGFFGLLHPSGFYAVSDIGGFRVGVYRIAGSGAATTLTAVSGSPFTTGGSFPLPLALTADGAFLIAANGDSRNLSVFRFNPDTGGLTLAGVQATDTLGATGRITGMALAVRPPFIDDPLTALTSLVKAVHITELRTRIDTVRAQYGLEPFTYTDPTLTVATTGVRAVHVDDLRAALGAVYSAAKMTAPSYTDPSLTSGSTIIKLLHIAELRAAVLAIE